MNTTKKKQASRPSWQAIRDLERQVNTLTNERDNALRLVESTNLEIRTSEDLLEGAKATNRDLQKALDNQRAEAAIERKEVLKEAEIKVEAAKEAARMAAKERDQIGAQIEFAHNALDSLPMPPPRSKGLDGMDTHTSQSIRLDLVGRITYLARTR